MMIIFLVVLEDSKDFVGLLVEVLSYIRLEFRYLFEFFVIKG